MPEGTTKGNYEIARERAKEYFLGFDQNKIISDWDLEYDDEYIYVEFFRIPYRIHRTTGNVQSSTDGFVTVKEGGFNDVLSIFDFLCHEGEYKVATRTFASVNSLKGHKTASGVGVDMNSRHAKIFDDNRESFIAACEKLGAKPVPMGDVGYVFDVFGDLSVILKFYFSDDEFPAQITFLWDESTLSFIFYETVFYTAGFLISLIRENME